MRVSQCCCGCSLRTGTLILLWLDLIGQAMSIIQTAAGICTREIKLTFLDSAGLGWGCLVVVITIYGIIGVEKHRPSYLLPYIGRQVFGMVVLVLLTLFMWVGSLAWRDEIVDYIYRSIQMSQDKNKPSEGDIRKRYDAAISMITVILVIGFAISYYFFSVIYSYYQQMQEEDKGIFNRGTGIVYAAPEKGYNDCPPAYAQQPAAVPYAHQQAGYPHLPQNVGYPQQFPDYPQKQ